MKKLSSDHSAISEIVGALMLVLIVVVAASSFAVFISQQQKIEQDNQLIKSQQQGESLLISSIATYSTDKIDWASLNITVSSMHQGTSEIDRISINDHVLRSFHVTMFNVTTNSNVNVSMDYTKKMIIPSLQVIHIFIQMSDFFESGVKIRTDVPITLDLTTAYSNDFTKVFYSPTPIIVVNVESQWNSSALNYTPFLILDGSQSDQPGDTTIIRWNWTIDCNGINYPIQEGRKVRFDPPVQGAYNITLLVENANGMIGISKTTFHR